MSKPKQTTSKVPRIFVLGGSDSVSGMVKDHTQDVPIMGNNDSWRLIPDDLKWSRCHISPSYFRQGIRIDFSLCSVILNLVSDPDQNPRTLRVAERITADYRDRLINDPHDIRLTRRDEVARKLQTIPGLQVPKVLRLRNPTLSRLRKRMSAEGFAFPAIVRRTGTQTGKIVGVFQKPEDLTNHFDVPEGDYYFTEYVDCRWSDGLYRKMRLLYIGGDVLLRHMLISDRWSVHGNARDGIMGDRKDLQEEERAYFDGRSTIVVDRARPMVEEIARRIKLDYFGVDCGPTENGGLVLFEANATMTNTANEAALKLDYVRDTIARCENALGRLITERAKPVRKR